MKLTEMTRNISIVDEFFVALKLGFGQKAANRPAIDGHCHYIYIYNIYIYILMLPVLKSDYEDVFLSDDLVAKTKTNNSFEFI